MKYKTSPVCVYVCYRLALAYNDHFHGSSMHIEKSCTDGSAALLYNYDKRICTIQREQKIMYTN